MSVRPLKVTARLTGEIAGDVPMLDALIEWSMSRHVGRDLGLSHDGDPLRQSYRPGLIPTPIACGRVDGFPWPIPHCSAPIFATGHDRHDFWVKRFPSESAGLLATEHQRVMRSNMGEFRSHRQPLRARMVDRVVWFVAVKPMGEGQRRGAASQLRRLLKDVYCLGKKSSTGYGRIAEWTIEPAEEDWSWTAPSPVGPVLMRPMPATFAGSDIQGARRTFGGIVPPYWAPDFFAESVVPC